MNDSILGGSKEYLRVSPSSPRLTRWATQATVCGSTEGKHRSIRGERQGVVLPACQLCDALAREGLDDGGRVQTSAGDGDTQLTPVVKPPSNYFVCIGDDHGVPPAGEDGDGFSRAARHSHGSRTPGVECTTYLELSRVEKRSDKTKHVTRVGTTSEEGQLKTAVKYSEFASHRGPLPGASGSRAADSRVDRPGPTVPDPQPPPSAPSAQCSPPYPLYHRRLRPGFQINSEHSSLSTLSETHSSFT